MNYSYKGKTLTNYCRENGINYMSIYNYMYRHDCGVEEAMNAYNSQNFTKEVVKYYYCGQTLVEWCRNNKVSYHNVMKHIYRGRSIEDAVARTRKQKPVYKDGLKIDTPIRYIEKHFENPISAYIKFQDIRQKKGLSKSEAMDFIKTKFKMK